MPRRAIPRLATNAAVALLTAPASALLARAALDPDGAGPATVDGVVAAALLLGGAAVLAWYSVTAAVSSVCLAARLAGGAWRTGESAVRAAGAPLLRRVVTVGTGTVVAVGLVVSPSVADVPDPPSGTATSPAVDREPVADDLGWGAEPDDQPDREPDEEPDEAAPTGTTGPTEPGPGAPGQPGEDETHVPAEQPDPPSDDVTVPETPRTHVVSAGESLWTIAAAQLGPDAGDEQTAAAWPRWFAANADAIGDDPDLIHPGQVLVAPADTPQEDA